MHYPFFNWLSKWLKQVLAPQMLPTLLESATSQDCCGENPGFSPPLPFLQTSALGTGKPWGEWEAGGSSDAAHNEKISYVSCRLLDKPLSWILLNDLYFQRTTGYWEGWKQNGAKQRCRRNEASVSPEGWQLLPTSPCMPVKFLACKACTYPLMRWLRATIESKEAIEIALLFRSDLYKAQQGQSGNCY